MKELYVFYSTSLLRINSEAMTAGTLIEALEGLADACMDAEAFNQCTTMSWFHYGILGIRLIAEPDNALACPRARCHAPSYGCAIKFGKQRFVAPKR